MCIYVVRACNMVFFGEHKDIFCFPNPTLRKEPYVYKPLSMSQIQRAFSIVYLYGDRRFERWAHEASSDGKFLWLRMPDSTEDSLYYFSLRPELI